MAPTRVAWRDMPGNSKPQICFLLAAWGNDYINTFCSFSLSTLLTPGNIPALAKEYGCVFTVLTRTEDIQAFERQPLFSTLRHYCEVRYVDIQDIIFRKAHSATLTVALERGMRSRKEAMLNTYFIYLMADYLFGSHALSGLLPYLARGVSAITAGNYQVVEEEVLPELRRHTDPVTHLIDMPNRELVAWSLRHLHPVTVANTVTVRDSHAMHVNRLFWRVDDQTIIGRFYLRHTLCLKPEHDGYIIGSSWDYSFLSEMCPSGNVAHLTDSDEYFVVELQPLLHESKYLKAGHLAAEFAATSLAEWTTAEQRANAHIAVVYHAGDIPSQSEGILEASGRYVQQIEARMPTPPVPIRGHFYWLDCIQLLTTYKVVHSNIYGNALTVLRCNLWNSAVFGPPLKDTTAKRFYASRFRGFLGRSLNSAMFRLFRPRRGFLSLHVSVVQIAVLHACYVVHNMLVRALRVLSLYVSRRAGGSRLTLRMEQ